MRLNQQEEVVINENSPPLPLPRQTRSFDTHCSSVTTLHLKKSSLARRRKRKSFYKTNSNLRVSSPDTGFASEDPQEPDQADPYGTSRRKWTRLSSSDQFGDHTDTSKSSPILPITRWRCVAHSLIIWIRHYNYHSSQVRKILLFFSNVDLGLFEKPESEDTLMFSPAAFKANKQAKINLNSINILRRDPKDRTDDDLRPIIAGLRGYAAIGDFPKDIIERIARCAWFQEFEPASVIVREGDYPMYYYFILSGTVLVSVIDRNKMVAKTVCTLTRGATFGELAIIDRARRKSTVIATEKTGLLILEDSDYIDIFMNGGVRFLDDPFLKTVTCFRKFPIQCLKRKPKQVFFSFFKAGTVLVEESKLSSWIFIVKSGSCRVMMPVKRLDLVEKEKLEEDRLNVEKEQQGKVQNQSKTDLIEHETVVRRSYRRYMKDLASVNPIMLSSQTIRVNISLSNEDPSSILRKIGREDTTIEMENSVPPLPQIKKTRFSTTTPFVSKLNKVVEGRTTPKSEAKQPINLSFWSDKETVQGRRTLATDLNKEYYYKRQKEWLLEAEVKKEDKQLITIQLLTPGMTFGFIDKFFERQPSLKLISDGCECFIIRKELYYENADDELLRAVGFTLRPYPREADVIDRKIEQMEWEKQRKGIMNKTLQTLNAEKIDVHDSKSHWSSFEKLPPIH